MFSWGAFELCVIINDNMIKLHFSLRYCYVLYFYYGVFYCCLSVYIGVLQNVLRADVLSSDCC